MTFSAGKCLALVETAHAALHLEKSCRSAGIAARIVPVPRSLSASCGLACEFACASRGEVEEIAAQKKIALEGIHELDA